MAEKRELKITDGEPITTPKPKFITSHELRSISLVNELVNKHGVIYVAVKDDTPLKVTKATLN